MRIALHNQRQFIGIVTIPHEWLDFWLFIGFGYICLLIAAGLAGVKISSFPANPLYWHYWLVANADQPPLMDDGTRHGIYRPYMLLWAASVSLFLLAILVLVAMVVD